MTTQDLFLGFDLSTQQLKIVVCKEDLSIWGKYSIEFDEFKDIYGTDKGVLKNDQTGEVLTPIALFLDAIETLLDRMKLDNFPFENVKGINGSCQQHGTVYYTSEINRLLSTMGNGEVKWSQHLKNGFSFDLASNWQDRSTDKEVLAFEKALGSAQNLCQVTGSKAHYRFSGLQFRKRALEASANWENTSHLGLIASFLNTILCGQLVGVEHSEACGTNLFDLQRGDWDDELLSLALGKNSIVDGVSSSDQSRASQKAREMLGPVVNATSNKKIASYLVQKYGFSPSCTVWPITGDNLATIMSLPLAKDDLLVSMGTSTTVLLITEKYVPSVNYHMFRHPVCPDLYMGMLCYCNGALARENVRDKVNEHYQIKASGAEAWDKFNELVDHQKCENVGIYFPLGEIIPNAKPCTKRFHYSHSNKLKQLDDSIVDEDPVMIIESQSLSCRMRVSPMLSGSETNTASEGVSALEEIVGEKLAVDKVEYPMSEFMSRPQHVYYVGGTSQNPSIVKKFDQVLGPKKGGFRVEIGDACALGGCFRAVWGCTESYKENPLGFESWLGEKFNFAENVEKIKRTDNVSETWNDYTRKIGILSLVEKELD